MIFIIEAINDSIKSEFLLVGPSLQRTLGAEVEDLLRGNQVQSLGPSMNVKLDIHK